MHVNSVIDDVRIYSELATTLLLLITSFWFWYGHLNCLLVDKGLKALLPLFSWNMTLKSYTAVVHGVCLLHARTQTIAENGTRRCQLALVEKKCILVILLFQKTVRVICLMWRWFVMSAMRWFFACVFFRELHVVFLSFRTEGASSCVGPTRSYRSCNVQVQCSVYALVFVFACLLLLFPRQTSFLFRSNMSLLVSLSLASMVNMVHQQYPFKSILNLCPWFYMGAITNKKQFFVVHLIFFLFIMA